MPRKTMNSSKIGMKSDITQSDFKIPLAASSPADDEVSVATYNSNIKAFKDHVEETIKNLKSSTEKFFAEKKAELDNCKLPSINLDDVATVNSVKVMRKMFLESFRNHNGNTASKNNDEPLRGSEGNTQTGTKIDPSLSAILEEKDDKGETDGADNFKENESPSREYDGHIQRKGNKRLKFAEAEDASETKFKRPAGRPKRVTKTTEISNAYRTPQNSRSRGYNVAVVTPGPNSNKPISVLRRPNPGEMAISMTGSPLLISHDNIPVHVPQISIPLSDGRVMTVLANEGLDPDMSICSDIDPETHERLAVLQELLSKKTRKIRK